MVSGLNQYIGETRLFEREPSFEKAIREEAPLFLSQRKRSGSRKLWYLLLNSF